jgi:Domain of unknown function (DUF1707)
MTTRYDEYGDSRIADARLRAGDADRERVADQLRKAHAEGRLDADELSERIGRCLQARTFGELERLTADVRQPDRGGGLTLARRRSGPGLRIVLAAIIALWALGAAAHGHEHVLGLWVVLAFAFLATRLVRAVRA